MIVLGGVGILDISRVDFVDAQEIVQLSSGGVLSLQVYAEQRIVEHLDVFFYIQIFLENAFCAH